MNKNKKIKKIAPVALAGLVLIGASAWLTNTETQTGVNKIKSGTMVVKFVDTSETIKREDTVINLSGAQMIPMTEKFAVENLNAYNFTLKNSGDVDVRYTLYLVTDESEFEPNIINVDMDGKFEGEANLAPQKVNQDRQAIDTGILKAKDRITYDKFILFANESAENANMLNTDGSGRKAKYHLEIDAEQVSNTETPPTNPDEVVDKYLTVGGAYYNDNGERRYIGGNIASYLKSTSEEELTTKLETATFADVLNNQDWNNIQGHSFNPGTPFWDTDTNKVVWVKEVTPTNMTVYDTGLVPSDKISDYLVKENTTGWAEYTWNLPKLELRVSGTIRIAYLANNLSQGSDISEQPSFTVDNFINYTSLSDKENKTSVALKDYLFTLDECKQKYNSTITFVTIEPDTNKVITAKVDGSGGLEFIYDTGLTGNTLLKDAIVENSNPDVPYNYVWNFTEYTKRG